MEQAIIFLPLVQASYCLAYLSIFLVGVGGNLLVAVVVCTKPHMQTNINLYILNMAVADLLMCLGE